jgi:hypothetical protein
MPQQACVGSCPSFSIFAGSTPSTTPPEQKRVKIHTASSYGDEYVTFNVHFKDAEDLKVGVMSYVLVMERCVV